MIQLKLAFHNLVKSKSQSLPFIFSNSMWIMITYIFFSIIYNTNIKTSSYGTAANYILKLGLVFVILIATLSMFYAERLLSKQRMQELGLYSMLGLTKRHLCQIIVLENSLFYMICIIIGSILGITFSKLAFMSLKFLVGATALQQSFTLLPLVYVAIVFAGIFILIILFDFWELREVDPINLWAKSSQSEKEPKSHILLSVLGIIILLIGYYISATVKPTGAAFGQFIIAIVFVVIGSYLVFITTSISLLKALKKNRKYYYKSNHFISVSNMLYRMKQNGAGLASISLLCTSILVALIAAVSLVTGQKTLISFWSPRDIQIVSKNPFSITEKKTIYRFANNYQVTISQPQTVMVTTPVMGALSGNQFKPQFNTKTEYTLSSLDLKQYNHLQNTNYHLKSNEILVYMPRSNYSRRDLKIQGRTYKVKPVKKFNGSFVYSRTIYKPIFIVAANKTIAKQLNPRPYVYAQGFDTHGTKRHQKQFAKAIQVALNIDLDNFTSKYVTGELLKAMFGSLLFTSILTSIIMIGATSMLIYYKQVSEGYADKDNYQIMSEIGLSKNETKKAIRSQVLTVFLLPIIGAILNLVFALPAIKSVLTIFSMYDLRILLIVVLIIGSVLIISYMGIYLATTIIYRRIIENSSTI
ncbi:ABC transporter permease [Liquorilactobacillus capillatus]|uniref:Peptide ABC superfamily ATP binding cassette transporter permease n=1 Tax=Liquorilactobacillus capillatus DSM 19910 TaxID=1423731 RepID=A0A0R1LY32_9LACO|nr:ABC transporter permease [Liquorilactobacillus capillatus]KRL00510.1 peptide ABC superfamily ATP binding cassette transporter permease [Liquorilactobacillus capillatus DSM 19910]